MRTKFLVPMLLAICFAGCDCSGQHGARRGVYPDASAEDGGSSDPNPFDNPPADAGPIPTGEPGHHHDGGSAGNGGSGEGGSSGTGGNAGSGGSAGEGGGEDDYVTSCYFPEEGEPYEVHVKASDIALEPDAYGDCPSDIPDGGAPGDGSGVVTDGGAGNGGSGDAGGDTGSGGTGGSGSGGTDGSAGDGGNGGAGGTDGNAGSGGSAGEGGGGSGGSAGEDGGDGGEPPTCGHDHEKVVLCHFPPGCRENAHTIHVGSSAVRAHLAHGDHLGPCTDEEMSHHRRYY